MGERVVNFNRRGVFDGVVNVEFFLFLACLCRYRQTRFSSRRIRKRVIFKQGDCNVVQGNVAKRRRRYLQVSCVDFYLFKFINKLICLTN